MKSKKDLQLRLHSIRPAVAKCDADGGTKAFGTVTNLGGGPDDFMRGPTYLGGCSGGESAIKFGCNILNSLNLCSGSS